MEREDGTLLRHKALPHGLRGYFTGQLTFQSLGLVPQLVVILVPSFLLFDDLMAGGASGWLTVAWVLVLGTLAMMPLGMLIGALVPNMQKVGTWGMLPVLVLTGISGIFFPIQQLWGWVQVIAQIFPTYWIGLGMRSAFLPDSAAALESATAGGPARRRSSSARGRSSARSSRRSCCGGWRGASPGSRWRPPARPRRSGCGDAQRLWLTTSTLCPSGSRTNAP